MYAGRCKPTNAAIGWGSDLQGGWTREGVESRFVGVASESPDKIRGSEAGRGEEPSGELASLADPEKTGSELRRRTSSLVNLDRRWRIRRMARRMV